MSVPLTRATRSIPGDVDCAVRDDLVHVDQYHARELLADVAPVVFVECLLEIDQYLARPARPARPGSPPEPGDVVIEPHLAIARRHNQQYDPAPEQSPRPCR